MPKQKDLKRLARTRMKKTGESYSTARAQLIRKKTRNPRATTAPVTDYAAIAGMSDAAVRAKTGRTWKQWVAVLDAIDATAMPHREIARHLHDEYELESWWAQTVTVGYERIRGLRERGQRRGGDYRMSKTRTFAVPVETLYRAFATARARAKWLGEERPVVNRATPHKSVRMAWPDGTRVEVTFVAKGDRSQAAVEHGKLPSKAEAERLKHWWSERFDDLNDALAK